MKNLLVVGKLLLLDLASTFFFLIVYSVTKNIALSVVLGMALGVAQIGWELARKKPIDSMQWVESLPSDGFGTATLISNNPRFVTEIHDRMPLIVAPTDYVRWLSDEPDPRDFMRPFPAEPMRMWPISTRVNKPENDDPSIVEPLELSPA